MGYGSRIVRSGYGFAGHDKHWSARDHRAADTGRDLPLPACLLRHQSRSLERRALLLDVGPASGLVVLRSSATACLDAAADEHHLRVASDQRAHPDLVHARRSVGNLLELAPPAGPGHAGAVVLADSGDLPELTAVLRYHAGGVQRPPAHLSVPARTALLHGVHRQSRDRAATTVCLVVSGGDHSRSRRSDEVQRRAARRRLPRSIPAATQTSYAAPHATSVACRPARRGHAVSGDLLEPHRGPRLVPLPPQ